MRSPDNLGWPTGNGGWTMGTPRERDLKVRVLALIGNRQQLDEILAGWPERAQTRGGLEWLHERLHAAAESIQ